MKFLIVVVAALVHCGTSLSVAETNPREQREDWQVIHLGGQRVGYASSTSRLVDKDGNDVLISDTLIGMSIKRFGVTLKMIVRQSSEEDPETGRLLRATFVSENPPVSKTELSGHADGNEFVMEMKTAGRVTKSRITLPDDVKSPAWQERYLEKNPLKPGETASFKIFSPESAKIATITLKALEPGETKLLDGSLRKLDRTLMQNSITPGIDMTVFSEAGGRLLKLETNVLGMTTYTVTREEALKAIPESELDFGIDGLLKVDVPDPHHADSVTYRITAASADPATLFVTDRDGQSVEKRNSSEIHLTVSRAKTVPSEQPDRTFLAASAFLDSEDAGVKGLADEFDATSKSEAEIATGLTHFVHKRVKNKTFSVAMANASEVAETLTGDCTEHAVLLAALLRVKNIPSRVVVGLVYVDPLKAFGGHMWTEAYVGGAWIPYDAALDIAEVRSGHLKMGDSNLAATAPAPVEEFLKMIHLWSGAKIEVVKAP